MRSTIFGAMRGFAVLAVVVLAGTIANAQFRAGLQGSVTDTNGAVVPGATVKLTNKETNQTRQTTTGEEGFYRFSALPPGLYTLLVERNNFKKSIVEDVKIDAEALKGQDVVLETGGIQEVVTVEADQATLDTEDASIRKTISTEEVLRLPQIGRDPYELVRLAPGVFGDGARTGSGGSSGLPNTSGPGGSDVGIFATENRPAISANGQRVSANNFQIDGVSVNSQTWGGAAVITPTQEIVKEVQVTSSTYSAEDGRNSGAQVKVVTQNGTNQFHGSGFFKYNDPNLNAFNSGFTIRDTGFATPRVRIVTPQRVGNKDRVYGGSLGGPIFKNKMFFFFAYEGLQRATNNPVEGWVETQQLLSFIINSRPNSIARRIVTAEGSTPQVRQILNLPCSNFVFGNGNVCTLLPGGYDIGSPTGTQGTYLPATNLVGGGLDGIPDVQNVLLENPTSTKGNQYNGRIDYDITKKDKFAFTLFYTPRTSVGNDTAAQSRPNTTIRSERLNYNTAFSYIRTITSNVINEARFNLTKWGFDEVDSNPNINFGIPRVELEQLLPGGARLRWGANRGANTPGTFDERTYNVRNVLTWVTGNHALKFGGEYVREINVNPGTGAQRPVFTFQRWNFFNDTPLFEAITADFTGQPKAVGADFETGGYSFFVQDDWKLRPNLTLNIGLRWEYYKPFKADNLGVLQLGSNGLADSRIVTGEALTQSDFNNFSPQLGFAWTPTRFNGKMVIRGGLGLGYDRLPNALPANARRNPPNGFNFSINGCSSTNPFCGGQLLYTLGTSNAIDSFPRNPGLGGGFAPNGGPNIGTVEIYGLDPKMRSPRVARYSIEAQYELPWKVIGTLGYQGSESHNFVRIEPLHLTQTAQSTNFTPVFFGFGDVSGKYNGMNARLQRRFTKGLQLDFNYKFSKSEDSVSFEGPCACTNQTFPIDQETEYGRSDYDVRHFFTMVGLWDLPFYREQKDWVGKILGGWQLNGILTKRGGFPWNPVVNVALTATNPARTLSPIRPLSYNGQTPLSNSNANFLSAGGIFPGSVILNATNTGVAACNTGTGCNSVFGTVPNGTVLANNRPGVGRNVFDGPKYLNLDMSASKRFGLPSLGVLGERAALDLRANFFNILNLTNITPYGYNTGSTQLTGAAFSEAGSLLSGRVVELQVRFSF